MRTSARPMRETRYAVMALAEAFPRPGAPLHGWGNRDDGPARLPRTRLARPYARRSREPLGRARGRPCSIRRGDRSRCSTIAEPLVRAAAAAALGRLGQAGSAAPLAARLADPSKIVWRAAAWALRRLGNEGIGLDAIKAALDDADPASRAAGPRGSSPISSTGWTSGSSWPSV